MIDGGGQTPAAVRAFVALAGGPDAEIVLIPTATESEPDTAELERGKRAFAAEFGVSHVTVLHTRDRSVADTEAFAAPLKTARGVWFGGGRQWRLVDSYMGTRTQREIEGVLARGGVVGGSSAGATIQGSYLVRGAREGNQIMMARATRRVSATSAAWPSTSICSSAAARTTWSGSSRRSRDCSASGSTSRPRSSSRGIASSSSAGPWSASTTARTTMASGTYFLAPATSSTCGRAAG